MNGIKNLKNFPRLGKRNLFIGYGFLLTVGFIESIPLPPRPVLTVQRNRFVLTI
jgi:hypothetical protein